MKVSSSVAAYQLLRKCMIQDVEELWCLALGPGLKLRGHQMLFRGTVDACTVHPRDIFRFGCLQNASQLIIAHNHPSGDPQPSEPDLEFTERLIKVGWAIEIPIVDHLILTPDTYFSMAEKRSVCFTQSA